MRNSGLVTKVGIMELIQSCLREALRKSSLSEVGILVVCLR